MKSFSNTLAWGVTLLPFVTAQRSNITLHPVSVTFDSDNAAFLYAQSPLLIGNDGSASDGGFRTFSSSNATTFKETSHQITGRSKIVVPVYGVGGRDVIVNIPAPDSIMRTFDAKSLKEIESARKKLLGDWSVARAWRSQTSGENYIFLFGKKIVVQLLIRSKSEVTEILEVQSFPIPIEGETCAISPDGRVFFSGGEGDVLYTFQASESITPPEVQILADGLKIEGLGTYRSNSSDHLLAAHDQSIDVFDITFKQKGSITLDGISDLEIKGDVSVIQSGFSSYPSGALAIAFEGEAGKGLAVGSLDHALTAIGIEPNTNFNPAKGSCENFTSSITASCSYSGFSGESSVCSCFVGFTGNKCELVVCENDCSGHGECIGPNTCTCESGWAGPDCSFVAVKPKYETEANGGDGDDPAIWIDSTDASQSKIVTTTKSEEGEGFGVFDLMGKMLQHLPAGKPNNVDVIYDLKAGNDSIDLAFAACRGDNTLCFAKINSTGLLENIDGGIQPLPEDYEPYGSCTYRSPKTHKQYLFVNNKKALYLQYELTATSNGTLQTTLVRSFTGGSGGQVEGCVSDEQAGFLFLGEEPSGIWRYGAEPDAASEGVQFAKVGDNGLHADVEGLTLVPARNGTAGYLIASSQGISSYFVYERAPPHEYVMTFTIVDNEEAGIDHVTNTDGLAVVGNRLNADFPYGLVVTHDDANELSSGGTSEQASFKLVSLLDVLGMERVSILGY